MNRCKEANVWDVGINCKKDQERKATRQCDGARAWPWQGKDRCSQSALLHHGGLHCKHSNGHFKQRTRYILTFVWNKILYASCGRAPSPVTNFPTLTKPWPGHQCERGVKTTQWRPGCVPVSWTSWSGLVVLRDGFPKKVAVNLDNLYHFFWTPMCQKLWAGPPPLIWKKSKRTAAFFVTSSLIWFTLLQQKQSCGLVSQVHIMRGRHRYLCSCPHQPPVSSNLADFDLPSPHFLLPPSICLWILIIPQYH